MTIEKIQHLKFDTKEQIKAATISTSSELVLLMDSGSVIRHDIDQQKREELFSVKTTRTYKDGGFDINAPSTIYTLNSIVVVVNDFKRHGFIHNPNHYEQLHIQRGEYYASTSRYPIALFNDAANQPHLIYAQDWNHLQIMNLNTRQILTADKSLIEEGAEERHREFYKMRTEPNKLAWPSRYDYFYGRLEMSPNNKKFMSAGWVWGSFDTYNSYEVEHFIKSNRIVDQNIVCWEHETRAACWIDNETVAVAYYPFFEGDDGATKDTPQEFHFYNMVDKECDLRRKISVQGLNLVSSEIHYHKDLKAIICYSKTDGVSIISLDGKILFQDTNLKPDSYHTDQNQFLKIEDHSVTIYQVTKE